MMIILMSLLSVVIAVVSYAGVQRLVSEMSAMNVKREKETTMRVKPEVEIHNWRVQDIEGLLVLRGDVYGHPNFPDGTNMRTSKLIETDFDNGRCISTNTIYILKGDADEDV